MSTVSGGTQTPSNGNLGWKNSDGDVGDDWQRGIMRMLVAQNGQCIREPNNATLIEEPKATASISSSDSIRHSATRWPTAQGSVRGDIGPSNQPPSDTIPYSATRLLTAQGSVRELLGQAMDIQKKDKNKAKPIKPSTGMKRA
nr:hypothetical protein [Tanacetum cinerariifolium]